MSKNWKYYSRSHIIECYSFKACYQFERQLASHSFKCTNKAVIGRCIYITYSKSKTDITLSMVYDHYDMLNHKTVTYDDYKLKLRGVCKCMI